MGFLGSVGGGFWLGGVGADGVGVDGVADGAGVLFGVEEEGVVGGVVVDGVDKVLFEVGSNFGNFRDSSWLIGGEAGAGVGL